MNYASAVGGGEGHNLAFQQIARWLDDFMGERTLMAVGHRVAHGGERYGQPVLIDEDVLGELNRLIPLVPLLAPFGVSGFILNGAGAAVGIAMWTMGGRRDATPLVDRSART